MKSAAALWWVLGVAVVLVSRRRRERVDNSSLVSLIVAECRRRGLEPALALATVEVESGFNQHADGDVLWAQKRPELYRRLVVDGRPGNPWRNEPELWHSYGLFQLLAPHHVGPLEDPRVLYDAQTNIKRGVRFLLSCWKLSSGDVEQTRLRYAGAMKLSQRDRQRVLERFMAAYRRWRREVGHA